MKFNLFTYLLVCSICFSCTPSSNKKGNTSHQSNYKQAERVVKDENHLTSKYQKIEDYQLAFKAPVLLQKASGDNPNFTLHYSGKDDNAEENKGGYYEVIIIDLSYGETPEVIERKIHHEILPRALEGSTKSTMFIAGKNRIVYSKAYRDNDNTGNVVALVKGGVIYMFNVMGNDEIDKRFKTFINSIEFYENDKEPIGNRPDKNYKEIITEELSQTEDLTFHQNKKHNYSIKHPENWEVVEDYNQMLVFVAQDNLSSKNFNIVLIKNVKRSLEELVEGNKRDMKHSFPDAEVLDEYKLLINNMESIKVVIKATNIYESETQYNTTYSFVHDHNLYIVNFGCDEKDVQSYKESIKNIISSFRIGNS